MPDSQASKDVRVLRISLVVSLLVVLLLAFLIFRYFLTDFAVAASVAMLVAPLHRRLTRWLWGRATLAAVSVAALVAILLLLPVTLSVGLLAKQAVAFVAWTAAHLHPHGLEPSLRDVLTTRFPWLSNWLTVERELLSQMASNVLTNLAQAVNGLVQGIIARLSSALVDLVLFVLMLFFLLRDGQRLRAQLRKISPVSIEQEDQIIDHLTKTVKGVLQAMILVPIAQAIVAFFGFAIFGVPAPLLWSVMVLIAALVPIVGSPLGWVPAVVYLFVYGGQWQWIGMLTYGLLGISMIDNLIKPWLLRETAQIHPLLGFLSILGGVMAFGPLGFLLGPIVFSLVLSAERIYRLDILRARPEAGERTS